MAVVQVHANGMSELPVTSDDVCVGVLPSGPLAAGTVAVVQVHANGMTVFVPKYGIEGQVKFEDDSDVRLNDERQELTLADGRTFCIFDMCAVCISVVNDSNHRQSLRVQLIDRSEVEAADLVDGSARTLDNPVVGGSAE